MPATLFKSFQYEVHAMTGNGSYVNLLKFVKSRQVNLFSAGSFGTSVRWLHLEAKKLDPSRSHDFPHQ